MLFFVKFAYSYPSVQWYSYGGINTQNYNSFPTGTFSRLDLNTTQKNFTSYGILINQTYMKNYPQLLSDYLVQNRIYLVVPNGNYIEIFDQNLNFITEYYQGKYFTGQYELVNWIPNKTGKEIVGLFQNGGENYSFKSFTMSNTTFTLSQTSEINFTIPNAIGTSGLKCYSGSPPSFSTSWCGALINSKNGSVYNVSLALFYPNGTSSYVNVNSSISPTYDVLSWTDVDNVGSAPNLQEFLYTVDTDRGHATIFRSDGSIYRIFQGVFSYSVESFEVKLVTLNGGITRLGIYEHYQGATPGECGGTYGSCSYLSQYKLDGSIDWSKSVNTNDGFGFNRNAWAFGVDSTSAGNPSYFLITNSGGYIFRIYKAFDGSLTYSQINGSMSGGIGVILTVGDMNYDGINDFIFTSGTGGSTSTWVYSPTSLKGYFQQNNIADYDYCLPSDVTGDGVTDLVCSSSTKFQVFSTNYTNSLPTLSSLTFNPSITPIVNSPLYIIVSASDPEADSLAYMINCGTGSGNSSYQASSTLTCTYNSVGNYQMTVYVSDSAHFLDPTAYVSYTQNITAVQSGGLCNLNGVCEAGIGETTSNCPQDCPTNQSQQYVNVGGNNSMSIPLNLVDVTDTNQGFLPEIYYGLLSFFSGFMKPFLIILFLIAVIFIILAVLGLVRTLFVKMNN